MKQVIENEPGRWIKFLGTARQCDARFRIYGDEVRSNANWLTWYIEGCRVDIVLLDDGRYVYDRAVTSGQKSPLPGYEFDSLEAAVTAADAIETLTGVTP